jgi:hypothetical protein
MSYIMASVALTFFAYLGFGVISFAGGDIENPKKNIGPWWSIHFRESPSGSLEPDASKLIFDPAHTASTGASVWNYTTGNIVTSSPAVTNGVVYVGSHDNKVYALNATNGASVWNYTTGGRIWSSSPAVADGKIYVGSNDKTALAA